MTDSLKQLAQLLSKPTLETLHRLPVACPASCFWQFPEISIDKAADEKEAG